MSFHYDSKTCSVHQTSSSRPSAYKSLGGTKTSHAGAGGWVDIVRYAFCMVDLRRFGADGDSDGDGGTRGASNAVVVAADLEWPPSEGWGMGKPQATIYNL